MEHISLDDYKTHCGVLSTPQTGYNLRSVSDAGYKWALDNGCFNKYEPKKILRELEKWQGLTGCLFAVLPDVVGNHAETYQLSMAWLPIYHDLGYPPAFVLQNGCTVADVPFCELSAVFVGGDNEFKKSPELLGIIKDANKWGVWVHAGRVGGLARFRNYRDSDLTVNSFDSTGFSIHPPKIKKWLPEMKVKQLRLAI